MVRSRRASPIAVDHVLASASVRQPVNVHRGLTGYFVHVLPSVYVWVVEDVEQFIASRNACHLVLDCHFASVVPVAESRNDSSQVGRVDKAVPFCDLHVGVESVSDAIYGDVRIVLTIAETRHRQYSIRRHRSRQVRPRPRGG